MQSEMSSNFSAETSKVRLLKGFIYAGKTRCLEMTTKTCEYFLVCRRFWNDDLEVVNTAGDNQTFNYQEQFAVLNDDKFLKRVEKQYLQLEIWCRRQCDADNNCNNDIASMNALGIVRLPLHQFFIAYRDEAITNHLCKGKLPVISIDAWVPIESCTEDCKSVLGELKCMLAVGSEEQISNLKSTRGYSMNLYPPSKVDKHLFSKNSLKFIEEKIKFSTPEDLNTFGSTTTASKTSDLLDMLQKALTSQQSLDSPHPYEQKHNTNANTTASSSTNEPLNAMQATNAKSFIFELDIQRANDLPLNTIAKGKKCSSSKRSSSAVTSKRFPANEAPRTYVTFQAEGGHGHMYKSHEGAVYATTIADKSTKPQWQQRFRVTASMDYLTNQQKRFILKIWKKAATDIAQNRLQPTPMDDAIIGFAALDLTMLSKGLGIGGWFNIVDFNGRLNGQLEVSCRALQPTTKISADPSDGISLIHSTHPTASVDAVIDQFESSLDLTHLNLGQSIKRKFTELEEISQRLRTRLVNVTGEYSTPHFDLDSWQPMDEAAIDDDDADLKEFECDINMSPTSHTSTLFSSLASLTEPSNTENTSDQHEISKK